jgi:capsular exopolysaccharide synthesis family protein
VQRKTSYNPLITDITTDFGFTESFKALRTHILYRSQVKNAKRILVTSAMKGEGKTTVSTNLALSFANSGKSVLLMDCDLRKPIIYPTPIPWWKIGVKGLTAVLYGQCEPTEAIIYDEELGIAVLPRGRTVINSAELLGSDAMQRLLDELGNSFDYIIMDTPPVNLLSDAVVLCSLADAVILVVRQEHAKIDVIGETIDSLQNVGADIMGGVLNDIRHMNRNTGYKYKYYDDYDYYDFG